MISRTIDELVAQVRTLPRLPNTTLRLVSVISDPASSLEQIVDTIRYDQVVTTEVLRRCNSAYFGLVRTITSVDDAIRYLGTMKVLQLVMAAHMETMLSRPQEGYGLPPRALWLHSVGVALGAQALAHRLRLSETGLVFTAGLLHDVGKVVLNEFVAAEYAEIVRRVTEEHASFVEAEQQVLGFTHPEVGARVAETWGLPEPIVRCIRYHHEPDAVETPDLLVDTIYLADVVCLLLGIGGGDDGLSYRAHGAVLERHALTPSALEELGADVVVELKSVQQLFLPPP